MSPCISTSEHASVVLKLLECTPKSLDKVLVVELVRILDSYPKDEDGDHKELTMMKIARTELKARYFDSVDQ
jgi:hypothetical protein